MIKPKHSQGSPCLELLDMRMKMDEYKEAQEASRDGFNQMTDIANRYFTQSLEAKTARRNEVIEECAAICDPKPDYDHGVACATLLRDRAAAIRALKSGDV